MTYSGDDTIVEFYVIYSSFTLILSWCMLPFLLYIILTQSEKLGTFKWFILNSSIWSLGLQTSIGLTKPYFLLPAAAGFQLGIFRHTATFQSTAMATLIVTAFTMNSIIGLALTLGHRYIGAFDTKMRKYFHTKKCYFFIFIIYFSTHLFIFGVIFPVLTLDRSTILEWAVEYDPELGEFFDEPSFFMIPHSYHDIPILIGIAFLSGLYLFFAFVIYYFLKQIRKNNYLSISRLQASLIASSIVQVTLTCAFLFTPLFVFLFCIRFDISAPQAMTLLLCFMSTHSIVDFLATLYFVLPYRKFIIQFLPFSTLPRNPRLSIVSANHKFNFVQTNSAKTRIISFCN